MWREFASTWMNEKVSFVWPLNDFHSFYALSSIYYDFLK